MKIRLGFVSNSSSSSFVVVFPRIPTSIQDTKELLFGNLNWYDHPYPGYSSCDGYPTEQIAETIFNDIQEQQPNSSILITKAFDACDLESMDPVSAPADSKYNWRNSPVGGPELENWYEAREKRTKWFRDRKIRSFLKEHKGKFIYTFEYGDEDGPLGCALEHGKLFDNLEHERISKH